MEDYFMSQRLGPSFTTQQLTSKPESFSQSLVRDDSLENSQRIQEGRHACEMNSDQQEQMLGSRRPAIFLTNRSLRLTNYQKPSSFLQHLKNQLHVHRFIDNLFTNSYILRNNQKQQIPDRLLEKPKQFHSTQGSDRKTIIPVFLPSTNFIILWDIFGFICNLFMLWLTPFLGSFKEEDSIISIIQHVILFFLILDFLIQFNRGIIISAVMILDRKQIIMEYLKTNAFGDCLSTFIWWMTEQKIYPISDYPELFVVIQIFLIYKNLQRYILEYFQYLYSKGSQNVVLDLIQLIIQIYYFAHITACVWHYVGIKTEYLGTSWIIKHHLEYSSIWNQYNASFYWATMTMTTVGYGDITAQNQIEMIFASIIMFLSSYTFAYTMSSIGIILKNVYDAKLTNKKNLILITQFMQKNQVEESVQGRIRNYFKLQLTQEKGDSKDEINSIITSLPANLQQDLNSDISNRVLKKMKLIINHFSKYTQQLVAQNLELISFIPGDIIYKQGDQNEDFLYFIQSGEVMQIEVQTEQKLRNLKTSQYLGYYSFFTGFPPKETAISVGPSQLYKINRTKFLEIIKQNRKDFEIFHHIKDKMIFKANYVLFDHKCHFCNRYLHQEIDCPLLQYKPDLESFYKKEQFINIYNKRRYIERLKVKHSTLGEYNKIVTSIKKYQEEIPFEGGTEYKSEALLNQKSIFSELQQGSSQALNNSQDDYHQDLNTPKEIHSEINTPKQKYLNHQTSAVSNKRSSFSKMKLAMIDPKPSARKMFSETRPYNMLQEMDTSQGQLRNQMNIDKVGLNLQYYMPLYSIESQIKIISKQVKNQNKRFWRLYEKIDKYTFSRTVKDMAVRLTLSYRKVNRTIHQQ